MFVTEIEIEISLLTKSGPQDIQITIMNDTQQYIKLNIGSEISIRSHRMYYKHIST